MSWEEIMAQKEIIHVTKRYKVTEEQDNKLQEIERELGISPSAIVRLALNTFLPKLKDNGFKYSGIKEAWDRNKF